MASNRPMPTGTAPAASDDAYCGSWEQLWHIHQRRIALWRRPTSTAQAPAGCTCSTPPTLFRGPPEAPAPTGCPTSSQPTPQPTPSRRSATPVTALPTAQMPPSGSLYSTGVSQLDGPAQAQLSPAILRDLRFMQDLLIFQHNQLRAQESYTQLLGAQAEQLKHSLAACNSLLNSALNALAQAQPAHTRLTTCWPPTS